MLAPTISNKKNIKEPHKTNKDIQDALKNITWTDQQVKEWKKNRKSSSSISLKK